MNQASKGKESLPDSCIHPTAAYRTLYISFQSMPMRSGPAAINASKDGLGREYSCPAALGEDMSTGMGVCNMGFDI
jgi:hypothetical protein